MLRMLSAVILTLLLGAASCARPVLEPESLAGSGAATGVSDLPGGEVDPPLAGSPAGTPTIGFVTQVPTILGPRTLLFEEYPERPWGSDASPHTAGEKYYVTVTDSTVVRMRLSTGEGRPASFDDIAPGMRAEVWFVGPILESYPARATAGRITIWHPDDDSHPDD
jgi:hypothetical protein